MFNRLKTYSVTPFFLASLFLASPLVSADETRGFDIDKSRVTISGISSGAHMATQLHIAFSDLFSGAAVLSGGPYYCAQNSLITAMQSCMTSEEAPPVTALAAGVRAAADAGRIADPANLADDRVWLYRGRQDSKISGPVHWAAADLYAEFVPAESIRRVEDVDAEHVFPADGAGNDCGQIVPPYVGDCGYDGAGELLAFLYPGLADPVDANLQDLVEVTLPGADDADLLETAYLYVPASCKDGAASCALHVALHGCAQSAEAVGTDFITTSGYLPWAEANGIVLAFPQVESSKIAPMNPHGCWDWWGYTGDDYAVRDGKQMAAVANWVQSLLD